MPELITCLVPTRARPEMLKVCTESLLHRAAHPELLAIYVYRDSDDPGEPPKLDPRCRVFTGPRNPFLGAAYNALFREARRDGIYLALADDFVMTSDTWDDVVRRTMGVHPDGILLGYLTDSDPYHVAAQVCYPVLTRRWIETLGYVFAEAFPFWFTDTWLDEIALMLGRKAPVHVEWRPQGQRGKTTRMRDLAFWAWVFEAARPERIEDARKLAALAGIGELRGITPNLSLTDPLTAAVLELELSDHGASDAGYIQAKRHAVEYLQKLVAAAKTSQPPR
ncbi:MAG: glycosyltransferase [Verrucomicrobia bacterium]|nr:glycosyltransferase [Verrucomicrobiota bacterium]